MKKFLRDITLTLVILCLIMGIGAALTLHYLVVQAPAPEMAEERIAALLGQESPVFYSDGVTQFGVLFEEIHRKYIKYEDIPENFIKALVAAEDHRFFRHHGVDFIGIARATLANRKAGRVVQGGSTLTQQTAKNLFKRKARNLDAKLKELLQALRLEYRYPKEKILEFYCNQFYVSGNGNGLGVAARYFFDKEPSELTLVEAAFIAGSVKQPNHYNPFLQKNREDPIATKKRAMERVRYVLRQMQRRGMLSGEEFMAARMTDLEFRQGKMSFAQNATMDLVKEGLSSTFLTEYLEEQGIANIATSGARIITTIDKELQDKTVYALRRHLSSLDVLLRGYNRAEVQEEYAQLDYPGDADPIPGAFLFGSFAGQEADTGFLRIAFDGGHDGFIAPGGLDRLGDMVGGRKALRSRLQPGDRVYVSVRNERGANGEILLDLERYPKVEGGAIVLREGAIQALCGGMSHVHFNRATSARRPMGSAFKTFVYAAALQLGWSPADMLDNRRNVFPFMDQPYFPRPDHTSPFAEVSMNWAGVKSENLATIWLLYHLLDQQDTPALKEIAQRVGMAPKEVGDKPESVEEFKKRMQAEFGINVSPGMVDQAAYDATVRRLKADFLFAGDKGEYRRLSRLPYGYNHDKYAAMARSGKLGSNPGDTQRHVGLLYPNYLGIRARLQQMIAYREYARRYRPPVDPDMAFENPGYAAAMNETARRLNAMRGVVSPGGGLYRSGEAVIFSMREAAPAGWTPIDPGELQFQLATMDAAQEHAFWQNVLLEGMISAEAMARVEEQMQVERKRFDRSGGPYSLDVLCEVQNFRVMLGLQYTIHLARACGVESRLRPVLPLALGANVVTLSEMARVYEAMVTGNRYDPVETAEMVRLAGDAGGDRDGLSLIGRIITPDGREVYRREAWPMRVFDAASAGSIGSILQNVVAYGTGNSAARQVKVHSADAEREKKLARIKSLPLMGKTGTANEYRNAAFLGYVPVPAGDEATELDIAGGYTLGVYVGFDDNRPMARGGTRISGAKGALPAWNAIAQELVDRERMGDRLDVDKLRPGTPLALRYAEAEGQIFLPIAPGQGGAVIVGQAGARQRTSPPWPSILDTGTQEAGLFEPKRRFMPFWRHEEATE